MNGFESPEGLPPHNSEALKDELYRARYFLIGQAYDRIWDAAQMDMEDSSYFHVLDTDDEEMPMFLRDKTFTPKMYKAIVLSNKEVGYMGEDSDKLLVMLPEEFLMGNGFDGLPESHQHIIVHRYKKGRRESIIKAGIQGLRFHYWEMYHSEYVQAMKDDSNGSELMADMALFRTDQKPLSAYEKLSDADAEVMKVEITKLNQLSSIIGDYHIMPQRRRHFSSSELSRSE